MKKLTLLLFAILFTFTSCEKDNPTVTSISLDKTTLSVKIGESYQFITSHLPDDLQAPSYKW